jgi:iron complex outermembrane receptor protein
MRTSILLTVFFLFFIAPALAQSLSGRVLDEQGRPAAFASVRLLSAADSVFMAGSSADEMGLFSFKNIKAGAYRVRVSLLGYKDIYSETVSCTSNQNQVIPDLTLIPNTLNEVTITSKKQLIEIRPDKVVLNIEGSALAAGNSAYELLQSSPGVVVTPQDAILLGGKGGTLILIDGRPTHLSGAELAAFLKSIPAESIKSIELIANPSSKYDAQGVAGIIQIRLRKNSNLGLNGTVNLGNAQSVHRRTNGGLNLNYRPGAVNFYSNYSIVDAQQSIGQAINRVVGTTEFKQVNPKIEDWTSHNLKAGADWDLSSRQTLGFMTNASFYNTTMQSGIVTQIRQAGAPQIDSSVYGAFQNPENNRRLQYNLNYRFADTLGTEWTIDLDRIQFKMAGSNNLQNQRFNANWALIGADALHSDMNTDVQLWSLKTDLTKKLTGGFNLESGLKSTWTQNLSDIRGTSSRGAEPSRPDAGRTNTARFDERISAAYINLAKDLQNWSFQAGLRAEQTDLEGKSTDISGNTTPIRNVRYLDFFPTVFAQYKLSSDGNALVFSASRRIERPAYQDLNPFIWQIDPYTSERGNSGLRPAYIQSAELKFTYKWAASLALGYAHTRDAVSTVARLDGEQSYTQPENLAQQNNISISLNMPTPITKWWEGYLWLGVWNNHFSSNLPEGRLDTRAWGGGSWISQQFQLPKKVKIELSSWSQFPTTDGMIRNKGIWSVDFGVKKMLMHDRATLKLRVSDIFKTQHWESSTQFGQVQGTMRNTWESRNVTVAFSWTFGNNELKTRERKSGAEAENNRIKSRK